jgi:hypothetical protein
MRFATVFIILPILLVALSSHRATPVETLPPVVLWAWERPEDLSFVDPEKIGVAFLAKTITLSGDKVFIKPRLQPLTLAPGTKLVAVVRIETDRRDSPTLSALQLERISAEIRALGSAKSHVQIDFDATVSERNFYRELLRNVRSQLPPSVGLSMTALASWCAGDDWLHDLPVDEAVPMLFRLGVDQEQFRRRLETGQPFESGMCQNAAGVSTDELVNPPQVDRLYIFNPERWTEESFAKAMETYQR